MIRLALAGQVADHALGIGALGNVFDIAGLHPGAQCRLDGLAALVVLLRPARVGNRRDIDKAGLDGFTGGLWLRKNGKGKTDGRERQGARRHEVFVHGVPLHGPG
jgi:hypothetical protein